MIDVNSLDINNYWISMCKQLGVNNVMHSLDGNGQPIKTYASIIPTKDPDGNDFVVSIPTEQELRDAFDQFKLDLVPEVEFQDMRLHASDSQLMEECITCPGTKKELKILLERFRTRINQLEVEVKKLKQGK